LSRNRHFTPLYAIIRRDTDYLDSARGVQMLMTDPRLVVSVVSVWASQADAESETNRLDRLGSTKGIRYSWQYTKLYEPSKDPGA